MRSGFRSGALRRRPVPVCAATLDTATKVLNNRSLPEIT